MNKEDLYRAIGDLDEKDLEKPKSHKKLFAWTGAVAAVLVLALGASFLIPHLIGKQAMLKPADTILNPADAGLLKACALAEAQYPQMAPYPEEEYPETDAEMEAYELKFDAWRDSVLTQMREEGYADGLSPFFQNTMRTLLTASDGENKVCSPLNIYMALSMLAEISSGETRQEILDVLGQQEIDGLRAQAGDVWNAQYRNDHATAMVLANSLWMNKDYTLNSESLNTLAEHYYASSFSGTPGSEEYDQALQAWLNYQTGGLLQNQVKNVKLDPETVMAIVSTLWYQAKWGNEFSERNTYQEPFYAPGGDLKTNFMHSSRDSNYYWAKHFGAVGLRMENSGGTMWLLLPDEGITPEQLLTEEETYSFLEQGQEWNQQKNLIVNMAIPKFDISVDLNLEDGLQEMGIKKAFLPEEADFSSLADELYVSACSHAVRVTVDEEGVSAAAFTEIAAAGACEPPDEETDFILNRPFVFVIQSPDGLPLFSGIVNQP